MGHFHIATTFDHQVAFARPVLYSSSFCMVSNRLDPLAKEVNNCSPSSCTQRWHSFPPQATHRNPPLVDIFGHLSSRTPLLSLRWKTLLHSFGKPPRETTDYWLEVSLGARGGGGGVRGLYGPSATTWVPWVLNYLYCHQMMTETHPLADRRVSKNVEFSKIINGRATWA